MYKGRTQIVSEIQAEKRKRKNNPHKFATSTRSEFHPSRGGAGGGPKAPRNPPSVCVCVCVCVCVGGYGCMLLQWTESARPRTHARAHTRAHTHTHTHTP